MKIHSTQIIKHQLHCYLGWPTLLRRSNGELFLVYSGGRESHVCPFGRLEMMTSRDEGKTWSWPRIILDSIIDDRDGGIVETSKGTLIATSFSSIAYQSRMGEEDFRKRFPEDTQAHRLEWDAVGSRSTAQEKQDNLGSWLLRSTNGGQTWSERLKAPVSSPHGPIVTQSGRLLYPGTPGAPSKNTAQHTIELWESVDDGVNWVFVSKIPKREGHEEIYYCEPHGIEASDGTLIVQIRVHENAATTFQTESKDGGKTWSTPHEIVKNGFPTHLLRLRDGRIMMTYGYRIAPFGCRAMLSNDNGSTWGEELLIYTAGGNWDLGYPSTVELNDGSFLTVWYEAPSETGKGLLKQAHWSL